ncbi:hypothetical protein BS17DRAFT_758769 [Gyrodon lividus]|nr:hypothetical protein BS17DRAFT_758769 [Gyrodon lividus]
MVTREVATLYGGKHAKGWHIGSFSSTPNTVTQGPGFEDKDGQERTNCMRQQGMGYSAEQSTQPQTLGYALADSPVGLLAWNHENSTIGLAHINGTITKVILTWASIYWLERAGPAVSLRTYHEIADKDFVEPASLPTIPTGVSYFPKDI